MWQSSLFFGKMKFPNTVRNRLQIHKPVNKKTSYTEWYFQLADVRIFSEKISYSASETYALLDSLPHAWCNLIQHRRFEMEDYLIRHWVISFLWKLLFQNDFHRLTSFKLWLIYYLDWIWFLICVIFEIIIHIYSTNLIK